MEVIPNANPNLVLVQVEACYSEGVFEMDLGLEVPIRHFKNDEAVGVMELMYPDQSSPMEGLSVLDGNFCDVVLKDRTTGSFFPRSRFSGLLRQSYGWADETELKQSGRRCLSLLIGKAVQAARGDEPSYGFGLSKQFEAIQALNAKEQSSDLEYAALCWLVGCESYVTDPAEEVQACPHDVLQYLKELDFTLPPRLLEAVRVPIAVTPTETRPQA